MNLAIKSLKRDEFIIKAQQLLMRGNSVSITGIAGLGKGYLTKDIIETSADNAFFINVDCNEILSMNLSEFYKLIYSQMLPSIQSVKPEYQMRTELLQEPLLIYMEIKVILEMLSNIKPVVIIIRDIERLFSLELSTFNSLKSLRFINNDNIAFLFLLSPNVIRELSEENVGELYGLITNWVMWTPFPDVESVSSVINHISDRLSVSLEEVDQLRVRDLAAGHYAITKALIDYRFDGGDLMNTDEILRYPKIIEKLNRILDCLISEERNALEKFVRTGDNSPEILKLLKHTNLINEGKLLIKLLELYLKSEMYTYSSESSSTNGKSTTSIINNPFIFGGKKLDTPLTKKEFKVLSLLYKKAGELVTREEIAVALWEQHSESLYSDWAIDQTISRIRKKIKQLNPEKKYLHTIKGRGFSVVLD